MSMNKSKSLISAKLLVPKFRLVNLIPEAPASIQIKSGTGKT